MMNPLPVAPSLSPTLGIEHLQRAAGPVNRRVVLIAALSSGLAVAAGVIAQLLTRLIALVTNLAFFGRGSLATAFPAEHSLGAWVIVVPVVGGLLVGLMARYGSQAIRGHGIPEAMEQVLTNQSRIPARMTFLKPLSAAISIGTGGPFGAEGPIIATGGALGSLIGQRLAVSAMERKVLLAAGAAAGMAATFGSPVAAVLLAVELLLFEYRPRSLIPVAMAATVATAVRQFFSGSVPAFSMPELPQAPPSALTFYVVLGAVIGLASVLVTRAVYAVEDAFERLPLHWMWWPALGGLAVGLIGLASPHTLGVGYDNIDQIVSGELLPRAVVVLCGLKFLSWAIALGSGTSGGTLAPLFTFGGGLGSALGALTMYVWPALGVDARLAALVGMAAMFAGASRALLASVVFAFETTRQVSGLLPLLGGCAASFLVSSLLMRTSIMTEKLARRGVRVLGDYQVDHLDQVQVGQAATRAVVWLNAGSTVRVARQVIDSAPHQGYPLVDGVGQLVAVLTRKDLAGVADDVVLHSLARRPAVVIYDDCSLREAADSMAKERIGRLPVVTRQAPHALVGIVTRSDLLHAHHDRLAAHTVHQAAR